VGAGAAAGVDPRQWLPGACGLQMLPLGLSELERRRRRQGRPVPCGRGVVKPALGPGARDYGLLGCE